MQYHGVLFTCGIILMSHWYHNVYSGINVGPKQLFEDMLRFVDTNGIRPHIDRIFPFEEAKEAIEYLGKGQHSGKIVVRVVQ